MIDSTEAYAADQLPVGTDVFDTNGTKIGTLAAYDPDAGYIVVQKGWLFHTDVYIPTSAITTTTDEGIAVQYSKDELASDRFTIPPMQSGQRVAMADDRFSSATATNTVNQTGDVRVPVREEELVVGKERNQEGSVHVHKDVVTEQQTVNVPLQHERVTVERVPYSGDVVDDDAFTERDIDVPVMGEKATVGKRVSGVEEVAIHKEVVTDQQNVSDTVRKERVTVDGVDDQRRNS
jgi:uncharacterized protein (TIGR02271 family)